MTVGRKYLKNVARVLLCFSHEHIFLPLPLLLLASQLISVDVQDMASLTQAGLFIVPNLESVTDYIRSDSRFGIPWQLWLTRSLSNSKFKAKAKILSLPRTEALSLKLLAKQERLLYFSSVPYSTTVIILCFFLTILINVVL